MSSARDRLREEIAEQLYVNTVFPVVLHAWSELPKFVHPAFIDYRAEFSRMADTVLTIYGFPDDKSRDPVERTIELLKANNAQVERRRVVEAVLRRIHQIAESRHTYVVAAGPDGMANQNARALREIAALSHPEE